MINRIIITGLLLAFVAADADAQNRRYRRRGTILGGLAGAAIGAAIGDKGDNETAGALIGGTVGAIAGGTIGNQKDQRIEHNRRYHSGHPHYYHVPPGQYYHPQATYPAHRGPIYPYQGPVVVAPEVRPVTVADVIQMRQRGLGAATMIRLIQTHGVAAQPSVSDVIDMHQHGVSERVIAAMQGDPVSVNDPTLGPQELPPPRYESGFGPSIVAPSNAQ